MRRPWASLLEGRTRSSVGGGIPAAHRRNVEHKQYQIIYQRVRIWSIPELIGNCLYCVYRRVRAGTLQFSYTLTVSPSVNFKIQNTRTKRFAFSS